MKLFLQTMFIILFMLGLMFWSAIAFTPAKASTLQYSTVFIEQQGTRETMLPEGTWCYSKPNICAVFVNKMKINALLSVDGKKSITLKPGEKLSLSFAHQPFYFHTVRLMNKGHLFTFVLNICPEGPGCTIYSAI